MAMNCNCGVDHRHWLLHNHGYVSNLFKNFGDHGRGRGEEGERGRRREEEGVREERGAGRQHAGR